VLHVDAAFPRRLPLLDGRERRPDELVPRVKHTEVMQVAVEQQAGGEHVDVEGSDEQCRRVPACRSHGIDRGPRRTARAGACDDQLVHTPHDRDVVLAVETVAARAVVGRAHAVPLVPTAQRRGRHAETLGHHTDGVQRFVGVRLIWLICHGFL